VSHEAGKYLRLACKHNGYVLEQIFSPLVAHGADVLAGLRPLAARCVTRHCYNHYRGFLHTQRKLFEKEEVKRAKTLLYAYRVALTGVHLLETGEVQAHLPTLNERFRLPFIDDLIASKASAEFGTLTELDVGFHRTQLDAWEQRLSAAYEASTLPTELPFEELNEFLLALRNCQ
jgi:predicted nucleotidyltransferase